MTLAVSLLLFTRAGDAFAQGNTPAAEALFVEGRALMETKDWAQAAEKFRASDEADPSVGARYSLGDCELELGKTASAWASYREAANLAQKDKNPLYAQIVDKANEVEARLTYVRITVPEPVEGLTLRWAGRNHPRALWDQRFPIDPGQHELVASAKGFKPWSQRVRSGAVGEQVDVRVPRLKALPAEIEPTTDTTTSNPNLVDRPSPSSLSPGRKVAIGVAAVGVIGLAAGSVLGLSSQAKESDALDNHCNDALECDADGVLLIDDAKSRRTQSIVAFALGGAGVAAAAALWFLSPPKDEARSVAVSPLLGGDVSGVVLIGSF